MRADTIIENAKRAIGDIIITYLRKIAGFKATGDKKLMAGLQEDITLDASEIKPKWNIPSIKVEVDNSYLDVEDRIYEDWEVEEIGIGEGDVYVVANGETFGEGELSVTDLQAIANCLERYYEEM